MPSIEERLEAVTHTLELVAHMQQQSELRSEQRFAKIEAIVNVLGQDQAESEKRLGRIERNLDRLERALSRVFGAVEDHEHRLQDLEGA